MTIPRLWWAMLAIIVSAVFWAGSIFAQPEVQSVIPAEGTLYLQVGNIDTNQFENLLDEESPNFSLNNIRVLVLDRAMDPELRRQLSAVDVRLLDYLPLNCFTTRLAGVNRQALEQIPGVVRVVEYRDAWKIQPGIIESLGTHQQAVRMELDQMGLLGLIVSLHPGEDPDSAALEIRKTGATVELVERVGSHDELSVITTP